jgi:predicted LPLAT superfamily acyltransferase
MTRRWDQMRERGNLFWLLLLLFVSRLLGRGVARLVLVFVVGYFLLAGRQAHRASQAFLERALGRRPTLRDGYRHFYTFAATVLDRFFLLGERMRGLDVRMQSPADVEAQAARGGCIVMVSHLGSFDVMRVSGVRVRELPLRVLMDRGQGPVLTRLLERINPKFAETIIDASERGPMLVLKLREALAAGSTVCMMADRVREGERAVAVDFLGGRALMPTSPWLLAATLRVPVILAFGLYRGGSRYDLHFEMFDERIVAPRDQRDAVIADCAQRYAQRLEHYARSAPYNWFNFYDYWTHDAAARH